jgi:dual specificity protein kinase YAK1
MDQQWQPYSDSAASSRRYNGNAPPNQPPMSRDYNGNGQAQRPAGFSYEQYPGGLGAHSMTTSPTIPHIRDGNGDVAMQDAGDPYSGMKYPMRPHHQQHLSGSRGASHQSPQEPSAAAQRYSPMEALSPSSPYGMPHQGQNQYGSQAGGPRQSPTRPGNYSSPNSYYANRQQSQQLPPLTPYSSNNNEGYPTSATAQLNAVFGNDPKTPRRPVPQSAQSPSGKGPVPEFTKVRSIADLQPKVNAQPAFRRANPEGGFISVSKNCIAFH